MKRLRDFEKALLFLNLQAGEPLPEHWGPSVLRRQERALALMCFEGDIPRARAALLAATARNLAMVNKLQSRN